jgi:hypothetical protein
MAAEEETALERIYRLFPMRTGIAIPDWLVIGPSADVIGAAGVSGAGFVISHFN